MATEVVEKPKAEIKNEEPPLNDNRLSGRPLYLAIGGILLTMLISALDQTIVGTAMPRIITELKGFELISWVTTAYLLTSTAGIPIFGKLSDIFGRKYILMGGIGLFVLGSIFCGVAQDINQLIYARAFQGIGAGATQAVTFTIIGDIFTPAERAKWQGIFFSVFGLASVIGPSVGGWIADNPGWRWAFYVNIPLEVLAIVVLYFVLPVNIGRTYQEGSIRGKLGRIDFLGAALSLVFIVPLLLALVWGGQTYAWSSWQVIGAFGLAAVGLAAFIRAEARAKEPIMPLDLFKNKVFSVAALLTLFSAAALFAVILYSPWFVQGVIGKSATSSGAILTPLMLMLVTGGIVVGQIVARIGRYKVFAVAGTIVLTFGVYLLSGMGVDTDEGTVVRNILIVGLGFGMFSPIVNLAAQNSLPMQRLGSGTATISFLRSIGSTLGAAVVGTLVTSTFSNELHAKISDSTINTVTQAVQKFGPSQGLTPQAATQFAENIFSVRSLTDQTFHAASQLALTRIVGAEQANSILGNLAFALQQALHNAYIAGVVISGLLIVLAIVLKEVPLRASPKRERAAQNQNNESLAPAPPMEPVI